MSSDMHGLGHMALEDGRRSTTMVQKKMSNLDNNSDDKNGEDRDITGETGEDRTKEVDNLQQLIEGVLRDTQQRFQAMSDQIIHRIDEMANRVDSLEKNISDMMAESGINNERKGDGVDNF